jgi:microcin C transport system substrate-binding protein
LAGICNPVVDALVGDVIAAKNYDALVTATRALDRVLLWGWYVVPQWYLQKVRIAYWNRFGYVHVPVRIGVAFEAWWVDPALAKATDAARATQ